MLRVDSSAVNDTTIFVVKFHLYLIFMNARRHAKQLYVFVSLCCPEEANEWQKRRETKIRQERRLVSSAQFIPFQSVSIFQ